MASSQIIPRLSFKKQQKLVENPMGEGRRGGDKKSNGKEEVAQFYSIFIEKQRPGNVQDRFQVRGQHGRTLNHTSHSQKPHGARMANGQNLVSILP